MRGVYQKCTRSAAAGRRSDLDHASAGWRDPVRWHCNLQDDVTFPCFRHAVPIVNQWRYECGTPVANRTVYAVLDVDADKRDPPVRVAKSPETGNLVWGRVPCRSDWIRSSSGQTIYISHSGKPIWIRRQDCTPSVVVFQDLEDLSSKTGGARPNCVRALNSKPSRYYREMLGCRHQLARTKTEK